MELSDNDKEYLLKLSRRALKHIFDTGEELEVAAEEVRKELRVEAATFVTLTLNGDLRGCIGKLKPVQMLYIDVIENTYSAAFNDYRFRELKEDELDNIKIEISILSEPEVLKYSDSKELIKYFDKNKVGVILADGYNSATFLPQVWEELSKPSEFLEHLCMKAGLNGDAWKERVLDIKTYKVINFKESRL